MTTTNPKERDLLHPILLVLFIGILLVSSIWVLRPFLMPLIWAAVIVIATWPAFERVRARLGGRNGLAVAAMATTMLVIIIVPITFAVITIIGSVQGMADHVKGLSTVSLPAAPPAWVSGVPFVGERLAAKWQAFAALDPDARTAVLVPYAKKAAQWFVAKAGSIGRMMVTFLLTVIVSTILYANGATVRKGTLAFARRLAGDRGENVAVLAAKAVRGVVMGVVLTALLQTAIASAGLFLAGVPGATLLTAVMLMLCLAQLGPIPVMLPAVIWLYSTGHTGAGTVALLFAILAGTIDNVVRPLLIRKGVELPLLLIFAGVIGGLIAFGVVGLFIGPMVLAVTDMLLREWVAQGAENAIPATEATTDAADQPA
jgi:predicted PurR-regulated permease PerM